MRLGCPKGASDGEFLLWMMRREIGMSVFASHRSPSIKIQKIAARAFEERAFALRKPTSSLKTRLLKVQNFAAF